jgi:DNA-binding transcriptional regulator LsrR (DeoR family)
MASNSAAEATYSDAQLLLAARLYYVDGILQNQIGRMVGVSQAKVSRMLSVARQRGLVKITVPEYDPRDRDLERELCSRFKLRAALVVRQVAGQTVSELRNTLGYFAGPVVASWLKPQSLVAVAGGRTLERLAESMSLGAGPAGLTIVQAMGHVDATPGPYDASEIGRTLARHWNAKYLTLNTPALLPEAAVCRRLLALKEVHDVFERLSTAEAAMIGVGNLENSVFIDRGALTGRDIQKLQKAGAIGEILGRFYDAAGKECETPFSDRVVSLPLERLRRVPLVVAVVAGSDRAAAIRGALRGGLVKALVTDDGCAGRLLEAMKKR